MISASAITDDNTTAAHTLKLRNNLPHRNVPILMSDIMIEIDGRNIRVVSLSPDRPITGVIIGAGPQVTLRLKSADPTDEDASRRFNTMLIDKVQWSHDAVALILNDNLTLIIEHFAKTLDDNELALDNMEVTLSAKTIAAPGDRQALAYRIVPSVQN